jgi:CDP-diacylglycerol pyrophosphatase
MISIGSARRLLGLLVVVSIVLPSPKAWVEASSCTPQDPTNALWKLVSSCKATPPSDKKCVCYDEQERYVFSHDSRHSPTNYLTMPSVRMSGIECDKIFDPPFSNLWKHAWEHAQQVLRQPRTNIGLAINSQHRRGIDQLHIHVSCVHASVRTFLNNHDHEIRSDHLVQLKLGPDCTSYEIMKISGLDGANSPFALVATFPDARKQMDRQSIAVIGSEKESEFYLLNTFYRHRVADTGHAEDLLDEHCTETAATTVPDCPQ